MTAFHGLAACLILLIAAALTSCAGSRAQSSANVPNKNIQPDNAYYNFGGSNSGVSIPRQSYDRTP